MLFAALIHDSALQRVNTRNEWSTQTTVDSCGERCAQLDDFKWFLPTDERAGDLGAPEWEFDTSDSESGVDFIDPDSTPLQTDSTAQQLLCPPVVVQTRPMEGCRTAVPRRLRQGRDVRTASDTVVSRKIHSKNVTRQLCLSWQRLLRPPTRLFSRDLEITATRTHSLRAAGVSIRPGFILGKPRCSAWKWPVEVVQPKLTSAEVRIGYRQELSVATTGMAGGSPPADIDICVIPDVLPIAMSVKTVMSGKSMEMDTPDGVVSRMEMTGGSPPVEIDISRGPDMLQISVTATEIVG